MVKKGLEPLFASNTLFALLGAVFLLAMPVHGKGVLLKGKTQGFGDFLLAPLNRSIDKFLYVPTVKANQVVMMRTLVELINRPTIPFTRLKMATQQ